MLQPFYLQGNNSQYPSNRRLGGPQSQSGCFGKEGNALSLLEINPGLST